MDWKQTIVVLVALAALLSGGTVSAETEVASESPIEFFEAEIRPLLVNRCYECHGDSVARPKGGLRLDSREALILGGESGAAIKPGIPTESLLLRRVRSGVEERMPPEGKGALTEREIKLLSQWIEQGAAWSSTGLASVSPAGFDWERLRKHWAWQPVQRPVPPAVPAGVRVKNAIDRFVVAGHQRAGVGQAPVASARLFVRRVFLDLLGLPPTLEEWESWSARLDPTAIGRLDDLAVGELVDELLGREQYGERWGRHWLDVARYSDVGGWTQDNRAHPKAWQYRDWVVRAFNADMPYDEFVTNQIVGDQRGRDQAIGTGFFALGPTYASDGGDPESIAQAKSETLDDRVDTFSRAFLGLTVACARCHDHKFDPIPIEDYYSIAGVFNNASEREHPLVDGTIVKRYHESQQELKALNDRIKKRKEEAKAAKRELSKDEQFEIGEWEQQLKALRDRAPAKYEYAHALHDRGTEDMPVALRGNLLKPGPVAPRRFLRIVAGEERDHFDQGSGRKELAAAVAAPDNPLTARVMVNRVWLHHFGRALVRTPSNFGMLGERPTHPELLDWLASMFVESGWSIKALHRLILTSATYRSSSAFRDQGFERDGDNRSFWRMDPRRMDAETWRDSLMFVTGELDQRLGGAAIENIVASRRRTLYAKVSRNNPLASDEYLRLFDFPIPRASNAKRTSSVVPQQFLFMLNSEFMADRARALALRIRQGNRSIDETVGHAYRLLYGRSPVESERLAAREFIDSNSDDATELNNRWHQYCQVLLSSNEFMYIR